MGVTVGIVGAAASIGGGLMGASAAKKAAGQQAGALGSALDFQQGVYNNTSANLNPYISTGTNALASLANLYGLPAPAGAAPGAGGGAMGAYNAFTQTPFYTFPLSQGVSALDRSGAARGLTLSGGQANALQQYGQQYASGNFQNYINALSGVANLGQSSAVALGGQGNQAASNVTGIQTGIGNALAAGTIGAQNQINNALNNVPGLLGYGSSSQSGGGFGSSYIGNALSGLFGGGSGGGISANMSPSNWTGTMNNLGWQQTQ